MDNNKLYAEFNSVWCKSNSLYSQAASARGVGYPELMVLYALVTVGSMTQKQIAEQFGMQKQTVHTVVRGLRQNGYITLVSGNADRREKLLVLTDSGKEYAEGIVSPVLRAEEKAYRSIGTERLSQACDVLSMFNLLFEEEIKRGL